MPRYTIRSHIKWALRQTNRVSFICIVVLICLVLRFNRENATETIRTERSTFNKPRSIIAVINTPKIGTVGLSQSFIDSWKCKKGMGYPSYLTYECPDDRMIVRAQSADAGAKAIQQYQQTFPGGQCLIVTAIRSPATWLPSLYSEKSQICQASSMAKDDMLQDYRRFLGDMNTIAQSADTCLHELIEEFNGVSLVEQTKIMDNSGGYSILGPALSNSAFAGCELLFLRMEQIDRWSHFIKKLVPDSKYREGDSHTSRCPELSEHIKMLQNYELTKEEKTEIYAQGGEIIPDWFDSYGYMEGSPKIKEGSYSTPGAVIAVINTPKTGTQGLTQNFNRFGKCERAIKDPFYLTYECPDDRLVIRAHLFSAGMQAVQQHRQAYPGGQCLIVTSIRHPATWFPSLYAQKEKICEKASLTKDELLDDYKKFLRNEKLIVLSAESCLPGLMNEFSFGSLEEQAKIMDYNGGYSILSPTSSEGVFAGCELLFLRMEQSDQWPEIIQMVYPEKIYKRGKSQSSVCPELADHIKILQDYELTMEERIIISTYGGGLMADWFNAYEYIKRGEDIPF